MSFKSQRIRARARFGLRSLVAGILLWPAVCLAAPDPDRVCYLTQTTLSLDETRDIMVRLKERFPAIQGPPAQDICYATENRQMAVKAVAMTCDLLLVVGSNNSSNSKRLVEVA